MTSIGANAFLDCTSLARVTIGSGVTSLGGYAFYGCTSLTALSVDLKNAAYSSLDGVLFDKSQSLLIQYPAGRAGAYTIPNSVASIGVAAFYDCAGLTNVTIPDSVTSIGVSAFYSCFALTSVTLGSSVTSIGSMAFLSCIGLTSVTIPESVTAIGDDAFWNCTSLSSAYFQGDAPAIFDGSAFELAAPGFTIYYRSTATGWTTPSWEGYSAQPGDYTPPGQRPVLSLMGGLAAVTPSFNGLQPGANYQLQASVDLNWWSNMGPAFTATNASEVCAQSFDVRNRNQLFFRLLSAP